MDQGAAHKTKVAADKSDGALDTAAEASTTGEEQAAEPDEQTSEKHFEFLELPPELRNAIYAAILEDAPVTIPRNHRRRLKMPSALIGANKMIHDEFRSYATLEAPVIRADVFNLDFGHVITYLNRLGETQLKQLEHASSSQRSTEQTIKIVLTMKVIETYLIPYAQVDRWLNRFDDTLKRAAGMRFEYEAVGDATQYTNIFSRELLRVSPLRQQRSGEEAVKIASAFSELRSPDDL